LASDKVGTYNTMGGCKLEEYPDKAKEREKY
jgi:hypothetical protein